MNMEPQAYLAYLNQQFRHHGRGTSYGPTKVKLMSF